MSFNIPKLRPEEMNNWCQSLQNLGNKGHGHIVIKKDPTSLGRFVPTLAKKPKSLCSRIYKDKTQRISNSFTFLTDFLNANEESLLNPKFASQNLEILQRLDSYFSTKSRRLKNLYSLKNLILKFKPEDQFPTVLPLSLSQAKDQANKEIDVIKKETETITQRVFTQEFQLKQKLEQAVKIQDQTSKHVSTPCNTFTILAIDREVVCFRPLKDDPAKDLTLKFTQNGQNVELRVHKSLYNAVMPVYGRVSQSEVDLSRYSAETVHALSEYIYLKKITLEQWAFLSEFYSSFSAIAQYEFTDLLKKSNLSFELKLSLIKKIEKISRVKAVALVEFFLSIDKDTFISNFKYESLGEIMTDLADVIQNKTAAYILGVYYKNNKNYTMAFHYFRKDINFFAVPGEARKAYEELLSSISLQDILLELNELHDAAERGEEQAMFLLCNFYSNLSIKEFDLYPRLLTKQTREWLEKYIKAKSNFGYSFARYYLISYFYMKGIGGPQNLSMAAFNLLNCIGDKAELEKAYDIFRQIPIEEIMKIFDPLNNFSSINVYSHLNQIESSEMIFRRIIASWSGIEFFDQFPHFTQRVQKLQRSPPFIHFWKAMEIKRSGLNSNNQKEFIENLLYAGYVPPSEDLTKLCFAELKQVVNIEEMNELDFGGARLFLIDYIHDEKNLKLEGALDSAKTKYWLERVRDKPNFKDYSKKAQLILEKNKK